MHTYDHGRRPGGCSVTGGYVYRGAAIPGLEGAYVFADYCTGGVRAIPGTSVGATAVELTADPGGIASFGQGPDGELYVLILEGHAPRHPPRLSRADGGLVVSRWRSLPPRATCASSLALPSAPC